MLANDVIYHELRRLIDLTARLDGQVRDLTLRLEAVESRGGRAAPLLSGPIAYDATRSREAAP